MALWVSPVALSSEVLAVTQVETVAQADASTQRRETAERFFDLLFSRRYRVASEYITPVLQPEFSPQALEEKVTVFQRSAGQFVRRLDAEVENDILLIDIQFERQTVTFLVSFDENLLIVGANPVIGFIGETGP